MADLSTYRLGRHTYKMTADHARRVGAELVDDTPLPAASAEPAAPPAAAKRRKAPAANKARKAPVADK